MAALIFWHEEQKWSIQSVNTIVEPKKVYGEIFKTGEKVRARYSGEVYPGVILQLSNDREPLKLLGQKLEDILRKGADLEIDDIIDQLILKTGGSSRSGRNTDENSGQLENSESLIHVPQQGDGVSRKRILDPIELETSDSEGRKVEKCSKVVPNAKGLIHGPQSGHVQKNAEERNLVLPQDKGCRAGHVQKNAEERNLVLPKDKGSRAGDGVPRKRKRILDPIELETSDSEGSIKLVRDDEYSSVNTVSTPVSGISTPSLPSTHRPTSFGASTHLPSHQRTDSSRSTPCNGSESTTKKNSTKNKSKGKERYMTEDEIKSYVKRKFVTVEEFDTLEEEVISLRKRIKKLEKGKTANAEVQETLINGYKRAELVTDVNNTASEFEAVQLLMNKLFDEETILASSVSGKRPNSKILSPTKKKQFDTKKMGELVAILRIKYPQMKRQDITQKIHSVQKKLKKHTEK